MLPADPGWKRPSDPAIPAYSPAAMQAHGQKNSAAGAGADSGPAEVELAGAGTACRRCGRDLAGLPASGPCPACGKPVAESIQHPLMKMLGPTAILGALWTIFPAALGLTLLGYLGPVSDWLQSLGGWGWAAYAAVFIVSAGIGFLPTYGQSFLGGWTFGFWFGFAGAMVGFVGGSVVGYVISRFVSKERIETALREHPRGQAVRDALLRHGFWRAALIIGVIRLPPNSPFALTNLVLASSGAKLGPYVLGTAIGMAPRTAIAVWIAAAGASTGAANLKELVLDQPRWMIFGGIAAVVIALAIVGAIGKRALASVTGPAQAAEPPAQSSSDSNAA